MAAAAPAPTAAAQATEQRIVRLLVHVSGVEKPLVVYAETVDELRTGLVEKLTDKGLDVPEPLLFTSVPPSSAEDAASSQASQRSLLTDAHLQSLAKNTPVWLLPPPPPLAVQVVMPGREAPLVCAARSLTDLQASFEQQLQQSGGGLSDGVLFSATAPTASAPSPPSVASWAEVEQQAPAQPAAAPVKLYAVWHWCTVPLAMQRLINPNINVEHGMCSICNKPLAHPSHLKPTA